MPIVPAMQIMCLSGAMRAVGATFGPIYRAIGRVDIPLKINITQLILLAAIIYPLSLYWGILGTAVAVTLSMIFALAVTSKKIMEVLAIDFVSLFRPVFLSALASIGMIMIISLLKTYGLKSVSFISLLSLTAVGAICYLGLVFVIDKVFGYDLTGIVKMFLRY
ncbi:hypothetical protein ES703_94691 [subsurface metagenome]